MDTFYIVSINMFTQSEIIYDEIKKSHKCHIDM